MTEIIKKEEKEEKSLEKSLQEELAETFFEDLLSGVCASAKDLAKKHTLSLTQVARIISSAGFVKQYTKLKQALASVEYDSFAYERGNQVILVGKDKDAIAAIKVMGDLLGKTQSKKGGFNQQINVNLEGYIDKLPKQKDLDTMIDVKFPGFEE